MSPSDQALLDYYQLARSKGLPRERWIMQDNEPSDFTEIERVVKQEMEKQ